MAEIVSKEAALILAGKKLYNAQDAGRDRAQILIAPAVYTAAVNDTMGTGQKVMSGARLLGATLSIAGGAAGATLNVGIRDFTTKVVIDATAIGNAIALTSAGTFTVNNGTKITGGVDYTLVQDAEIYITFTGATTTNQALLLRVVYLGA